MQKNFKKFFAAQDMTQGSPVRNLITFSIPLLIGNLVQQLYNTVDSMVVGRYVGDAALAAVGASGPVLNLLLLLAAGIATGAGILVSQFYGAHKKEELSKAIGTCLTLIGFTGIIIMIAGPMVTRPLMTVLDTPPEVYDMAVSYLNIIFSGILALGGYNMISGILRGMGDSLTPLLFLIIACLLNIVLDVIFVKYFHLGVSGVALATVTAYFVSMLLCVWRLTHIKDTVHLSLKSFKPDKVMTVRILKLGLPSGLTQAIFSLAAIVVQRLTNSFGKEFMACAVVVMRVDSFAMMPNFTFGMAMTTFVGQNVGAGKIDRVHQGMKSGVRLAVGVSVVLVATILIFGENLMRMFTKTDEVVNMGIRMMRILSLGYIAMSVTQSLSGVMRGAGDTMTPMWVSVITTVVIRVPIAYSLAYLTRSETMPGGNPNCIFISLLTAWLMGALITSIQYKRGKWRKKAQKDWHLKEA